MNKTAGNITVDESAIGMLKVLSSVSVASSKEGILSYDGEIYPW